MPAPTRTATAALLLLAALTALAGRATAGPSPGWSYRGPENEMAFPAGATGGITFPNTAFVSATGDADIVATGVASYSIAPASRPDRVSSLPYRFAVDVRDDASGETARFTFAGLLSGSVWRTGGDLRNRFTGLTTQSAELGGYEYAVALTGFDGPTGYGDAYAGAVTARVSVAEPTGEPAVHTPEPATAVLALAALPLAALARAASRAAKPARPVPSA